MSYIPTNWKTGDIVTSEKLNHIEDGIANIIMVINDTRGTFDKTWQEIYDAMAQGKLCVVKYDSGTLEDGIRLNMISSVFAENGNYVVGIDQFDFNASSAAGYPQYNNGGSGGVEEQ